VTESKEKGNWRVNITFCMANLQPEEEREVKKRKKRRKEKQIDTKPDQTIIHTPLRKEEDAKTNQIMRWKHD